MAIIAAGWMAAYATLPIPMDDAYYQTGDEMRDLQARRAINTYLSSDSTTHSAANTNATNTPCQPSITFTTVTDTTVTAIIHRCPAQ
jgi:hypothetical protein